MGGPGRAVVAWNGWLNDAPPVTISVAAERSWQCPSCGTSQRSLIWLAIDCVERPDLRRALADGQWTRFECTSCRGTLHRDEGLLLLRACEVAPLVLGLPANSLERDIDLTGYTPLFDRVRASLGKELAGVPGPLLPVPFDVLTTMAKRDVDSDAAQGAKLARAGEPPEAWRLYRVFLGHIEDSARARRLGHALNQLRRVQSLTEVEKLQREFPEITEAGALDALRAEVDAASDGEARHVALTRLRLVEGLIGGELEGAWAEFEAGVLALLEDHVRPRVERLLAAMNEAMDAGDFDIAVGSGRELLGIVRDAGLEELEAWTCTTVAAALYSRDGLDKAEDLEEAVTLFERASEITASGMPGPETDMRLAGILVSLGATYAARRYRDPLANQLAAIECQEQVLRLVSMEDDPVAWAMAHTNLGLSLLELAKAERDPAARVSDAIAHFEESLRWRSMERDPFDWAHTQVNLGLAFSRRQDGNREEDLRRALHHYQSALKGFTAAGDRGAAGAAQALHNIAAMQVEIAGLEETTETERAALLDDAESAIRQSIDRCRPLNASLQAGRAWDQLGKILAERDDLAGASSAYRAALQTLQPATSPRECRETARTLAALETDTGNWAAAADAWMIAVDAATHAVEGRGTLRTRLDEIAANLNVYRWAAYAFSRVGDLQRATEALERSRAMQLSMWLRRETADLEKVAVLDPALRDRFVQLHALLDTAGKASIGGTDADLQEMQRATEDLRKAVEQIRSLPGLSDFLQHPSFNDIARRTDPTEPLVYLLTSPVGSAAIVVWGEEGPNGVVELIDAPSLTSTELASVLVSFDQTGLPTAGYLAAQVGDTDDLDGALTLLDTLLGERLLRPLADLLRAQGAKRVVFVPIAVTGLFPLGALQWRSPDGYRCLLDEFDVAYAPSAHVRDVCAKRIRSHEHRTTRLLAVGNPLPSSHPLTGAELEARVVASRYRGDEAVTLVGTAATKRRVLDLMRTCTHIHFACHGWSDMRAEAFSAHLVLSNDEPLYAREVAALEECAAHVVVASACQTGIVQGFETIDESLGLPAAFLAAGAATVIATLWPVDDYATALLMSRFYELLDSRADSVGATAASALRVAQLWLRNLTPDEEERYVRKRGVLQEHRTRSALSRRSAKPELHETPYSAPSLWAPFIVVGA